MILAATVPQVDVLHDWLDYVNAGAAIVAIVIALIAQNSANNARREVAEEGAKERRRVFELGILSELVRLVDDGFLNEIETYPHRLRQVDQRLDQLPEAELPYWRHLKTHRWRDEVSESAGFRDRIRRVNEAHSRLVQERAQWDDQQAWQSALDESQIELSAVQREFEAYVRDRLIRELREAIVARAEAPALTSGRPWIRWRRRRPVGHVD
jgi:hypothetical protein